MGTAGKVNMKKIDKFGQKKYKWIKRFKQFFVMGIKGILTAALLGIMLVAAINILMVWKVSDRILTESEAKELTDVDYILLLGASVHGKEPSPVLRSRLDTGIDLYRMGISERMLMSGDSSDQYYDEVGTMQLYAVNAGIEVEKIDLDSQGLCTYDSMKRAKEIYGTDKVVVVTQRYHMYRALYVAQKLGMEAYGVASDNGTAGEYSQEIREIAARCKDFLMLHLENFDDVLSGQLVNQIKKIAGKY